MQGKSDILSWQIGASTMTWGLCNLQETIVEWVFNKYLALVIKATNCFSSFEGERVWR